jgi:hypothetical protein
VTELWYLDSTKTLQTHAQNFNYHNAYESHATSEKAYSDLERIFFKCIYFDSTVPLWPWCSVNLVAEIWKLMSSSQHYMGNLTNLNHVEYETYLRNRLECFTYRLAALSYRHYIILISWMDIMQLINHTNFHYLFTKTYNPAILLKQHCVWLTFWRFPVRISVGTPTLLYEVFRGLPKSPRRIPDSTLNYATITSFYITSNSLLSFCHSTL